MKKTLHRFTSTEKEDTLSQKCSYYYQNILSILLQTKIVSFECRWHYICSYIVFEIIFSYKNIMYCYRYLTEKLKSTEGFRLVIPEVITIIIQYISKLYFLFYLIMISVWHHFQQYFLVLKVLAYIITSITGRSIELVLILLIISFSTIETAIILYTNV